MPKHSGQSASWQGTTKNQLTLTFNIMTYC